MPRLERDLTLIGNRATTLFQTDAWVEAWLSSWGATRNGLSGVKLYPDRAVYQIKQRIKHVVPVTSTVPIGNPASGLNSVRREYAQWTREQLQQWSAEAGDQIILHDVITDSPTYRDIQEVAASDRLYPVVKGGSRAYAVDVSTHAYASYLSSRSGNTRLKLHNRRKRLADQGEIELLDLWPDVERYIDLLNEFHVGRWGKPCFSGRNRQFILQLLPQLHAEGHRVELSVLRVGGQCVSLALDIAVGDRIHNLQAGYIEDYARGVSLGILHLGYQIEKACADPNVVRYDFMAGHGKHSDYKAALATHYCDLADIVLVKAWWLKALYQWRNREAKPEPGMAGWPQ